MKRTFYYLRVSAWRFLVRQSIKTQRTKECIPSDYHGIMDKISALHTLPGKLLVHKYLMNLSFSFKLIICRRASGSGYTQSQISNIAQIMNGSDVAYMMSEDKNHSFSTSLCKVVQKIIELMPVFNSTEVSVVFKEITSDTDHINFNLMRAVVAHVCVSFDKDPVENEMALHTLRYRLNHLRLSVASQYREQIEDIFTDYEHLRGDFCTERITDNQLENTIVS